MERLTPRRGARLRAAVALPSSVAVPLGHVASAARQRLAAGGAGGVGVVLADEQARGRQAAEVLAEQLGRPLHRVDLAAIASRYIGETEKNRGSTRPTRCSASAVRSNPEPSAGDCAMTARPRVVLELVDVRSTSSSSSHRERMFDGRAWSH
jgi:hypothetical protein